MKANPIEIVETTPIVNGNRLADGFTKRERIAMAAMQGILGDGTCNSSSAELVAVWSVECADALLVELHRERKPEATS